MKVSIEYKVKGSKKKYPDVAQEVFVPDDWTIEQIKDWFEKRHHNICGVGVNVININIENVINLNIEKDNEVSNESK